MNIVLNVIICPEYLILDQIDIKAMIDKAKKLILRTTDDEDAEPDRRVKRRQKCQCYLC